MAKNYPPDGYVVGGGDTAWGTDIDHDDTKSQTGDSSVKFLATTPSATPFLASEELLPCTDGDLFRVGGWVQASSIVAGRWLYIALNWYTRVGVACAAPTSVVWNAEVDVVDTWEYKSGVVTAPATAAYFRLILAKDNVNTYTGNFDSMEVVRQPPAFEAVIAGAWVAVDPAVTVVPFDSEIYDYGGIYNNANYELTAPVGGIYGLTAAAGVLALGVDDAVAMFFQKDTGGGYVNWGPAQTVTGPGYNLVLAAFYSWLSISHAGAWLNTGDKVRVMFGNKTGGNLTGVTFNGTVFSAAKLE